jgi:mRNA interferase MazF
MYKQGDILLVPIPFTDLTSSKRRPVLVLSNSSYNNSSEDIIVVAITSNIRGGKREVVFDDSDMMEGYLPKTSCIRSDKVYTLSKSIVVKRYGALSQSKTLDVKGRLIDIVTE